jgi:hypothetical protein
MQCRHAQHQAPWCSVHGPAKCGIQTTLPAPAPDPRSGCTAAAPPAAPAVRQLPQPWQPHKPHQWRCRLQGTADHPPGAATRRSCAGCAIPGQPACPGPQQLPPPLALRRCCGGRGLGAACLEGWRAGSELSMGGDGGGGWSAAGPRGHAHAQAQAQAQAQAVGSGRPSEQRSACAARPQG